MQRSEVYASNTEQIQAQSNTLQQKVTGLENEIGPLLQTHASSVMQNKSQKKSSKDKG